MSVEDVNRYADLIERAARGLKRVKHQKHIGPAKARIQAVMTHRFRRQEKAVMAAIKPHIERQLLLHPVREAITPQGRTFASALLPKTLQPLSFAASPSETSEYDDAITDLIAGAASTLTKELGSKAAGTTQSVAGRYLHDNSLSRLTGDLDETSVERLQDALATAWDKGGDFDAMVKAVTDTFEDFSTTRAERIAATEANDAYSEGREATARQMGMGQKRWNVGSDGCPVCQENEDQGWIDIDDVFPSGDAAPTAHVNCDCDCDYRTSTDVAESEAWETKVPIVITNGAS